jgi:GT2 family glycosyltransferase
MLAIVIPYYKLTFFEATLQSLACQSDKRFKVYIGDDASSENPMVLLEKYQGEIEFIYHKFDSNLGGTSLVKQWERCIALIENEEWIMILGDDDVLGDNVVEEFYKKLKEIEEAEINVVRFATQLIDEEGKFNSEIYYHPVKEKSTDFLFKKIENLTRSSLSEYFFKREILEKCGFHDFPLGWHSDDMLFLQVSNFKIIYTINLAIIRVRISNRSISGNSENGLQKNKATSLFYHTLANNYLAFFTKEQTLKILEKVERDFFKKKSFFMFFKISKWHLKKTGWFNLVKFIRRIYINY